MLRRLGVCEHCGGVPVWKTDGTCWGVCPECWFRYDQQELLPQGVLRDGAFFGILDTVGSVSEYERRGEPRWVSRDRIGR